MGKIDSSVLEKYLQSQGINIIEEPSHNDSDDGVSDELVVGKWYKYYLKGKPIIFRYYEAGRGYGWGDANEWSECKMTTKVPWKRISSQEIEDKLISELRSRGMKSGNRFTAVRDTVAGEQIHCSAYSKNIGEFGSGFVYVESTDTLYTYGRGRFVAYEQGKFCKINK